MGSNLRRPALSVRRGLAAGAVALAVAVPAVAGAAVTPHAALFAKPSGIATVGPWLVVTNQQNSTLTVLHAAGGTLAGRVSAQHLGIKAPDAIVAATVAKHREVFVAGAGGAVANLSLAAKGTSIVTTRVRTLKPTGCVAGAAARLALDGRGHLVEACANGAVTEWVLTTGMLLRQFSPTTTGVTNATGITVQGTTAYVANAATTAAGSAPDGVVALSLLTAKRLRTVTNATNPSYAFSSLGGIASDGAHLWVTSTESDTVDELAVNSLAFLQASGTNLYNPGAVVATKSLVWISSVNGPVSSMVTQFTVASPTQSPWMMCNTNDQYKFDDPSGFALSAGSLWVTNASDNLVDQMNATSGVLVHTFA